MERKIIHLDMDCFYAAIEMRDHPEVAGKPLAVGGIGDRRGVLTTCNYAARSFGVRSAMPTWKALQLCPHMVVMPVRFEVYQRESARVRRVLEQFTSMIEPLSLDEAYLDVSSLPYPGAVVAAEIRDRIFEETALTASAGIASNKLLAKIASDWKKPNGQYEIRSDHVESFMKGLPVTHLWGVGEVSAEKLGAMGVRTCGDLQRFSRMDLVHVFGKFGVDLFEMCRGLDQREVETHRERKSLSCERTYSEDLVALEECEVRVEEIYRELLEELDKIKEGGVIGKLFVKLKFADFTQTTVERTGQEMKAETFQGLLAEAFWRGGKPVRLIGVGVRFLSSEKMSRLVQLELPFDWASRSEGNEP